MSKRIVLAVVGSLFLVGLGILLGIQVAGRRSGAAPPPRLEPVNPAKGAAAEGKTAEAEGLREIEMNEARIKQCGIVEETAKTVKRQAALTFNGEVVMNLDRIAQIVPRVTGVVREVRKNLGDWVRRGEVVAVLESRELADLFAGFRAARQKVGLAQTALQREEQLYKKRISAQQDFAEAQNALAEAEIELQAARQRLQALGYDDEKTATLTAKADSPVMRYEMTAPFDATVIEKRVNLGEVLKDDTAAFKIADLSSVWVNLDVQQKDLALVRVGQAVVIADGPNVPEVTGRIAYIEPTVVEQTRTVHARVNIANTGGRWRPGLFVTGRLLLEGSAEVLQAPTDAVLLVDGAPCVFLRTEKGFRPQPVKIGQSTDAWVEILDGLRPGQRYAVRGAFTLKSELDKPEAE